MVDVSYVLLTPRLLVLSFISSGSANSLDGSGTFWRRRFGDAVLAPAVLAPRKGAGHFGAEEGYKPTQNGSGINPNRNGSKT